MIDVKLRAITDVMLLMMTNLFMIIMIHDILITCLRTIQLTFMLCYDIYDDVTCFLFMVCLLTLYDKFLTPTVL